MRAVVIVAALVVMLALLVAAPDDTGVQAAPSIGPVSPGGSGPQSEDDASLIPDVVAPDVVILPPPSDAAVLDAQAIPLPEKG